MAQPKLAKVPCKKCGKEKLPTGDFFLCEKGKVTTKCLMCNREDSRRTKRKQRGAPGQGPQAITINPWILR